MPDDDCIGQQGEQVNDKCIRDLASRCEDVQRMAMARLFDPYGMEINQLRMRCGVLKESVCETLTLGEPRGACWKADG